MLIYAFGVLFISHFKSCIKIEDGIDALFAIYVNYENKQTELEIKIGELSTMLLMKIFHSVIENKSGCADWSLNVCKSI